MHCMHLLQVFLQGTIGSTFFQQVRHIIQSPERLPSILGAALPDSSNFFMQFIALRAMFLIWLRMCVPHGGVWQNWVHRCFCPAWCCSACNTGAKHVGGKGGGEGEGGGISNNCQDRAHELLRPSSPFLTEDNFVWRFTHANKLANTRTHMTYALLLGMMMWLPWHLHSQFDLCVSAKCQTFQTN